MGLSLPPNILKRTLRLILVASLLALSDVSVAGVLVSPGVHWKSFSFRPKDAEATPNYYGYGGSLRFGYSLAQVFDLTLFGSYTPAQLESASSPTEPDALHRFVGVALGLRIASSVFIEGRVGRLDYSLMQHKHPDEISGHWAGVGSGASIGGIIVAGKSHFWQVTLDADVGTKMQKVDATADDKQVRNVDAMSLSLAYVFNHFYNSSVDNSSIGAFLLNSF